VRKAPGGTLGGVGGALAGGGWGGRGGRGCRRPGPAGTGIRAASRPRTGRRTEHLPPAVVSPPARRAPWPPGPLGAPGQRRSDVGDYSPTSSLVAAHVFLTRFHGFGTDDLRIGVAGLSLLLASQGEQCQGGGCGHGGMPWAGAAHPGAAFSVQFG